MIRELDLALKHYADIIKRDLDQDVERVFGAGLQEFCGAELRKGIEIVTEALGLEQLVEDAALVITGEGISTARRCRARCRSASRGWRNGTTNRLLVSPAA